MTALNIVEVILFERAAVNGMKAIIKGEIKVGDIAKKDATSLLVQPAK